MLSKFCVFAEFNSEKASYRENKLQVVRRDIENHLINL